MPNWSYISELDAFEIYHQVQEDLSSEDDDDFSFSYAFRNALLGAAGTAVSNLVTYPLDLVCTRLQVQSKKPSGRTSETEKAETYDGVSDAIAKIYSKEGGLSAFYSGIASDTAKSVTDSFIFFFGYNVLWRLKKKHLPAWNHPLLQALDGISVGFLAGAFTKALTTPIANVVTRQQVQKQSQEQSATEIINDIYARKGLAGFWTGYPASLILTLNPALTFFLDAAVKRAMNVGEDPSPLITFMLAANGKATANMLMYPFKLAKARAQVANSDESRGEKGTAPAPRSDPKSMPKNPIKAVAHIAETEGVGALYAGVWAELLKGFFSHGLTMLIKDQLPMFGLNLLMFIMRMKAKYRKRKQV